MIGHRGAIIFNHALKSAQNVQKNEYTLLSALQWQCRFLVSTYVHYTRHNKMASPPYLGHMLSSPYVVYYTSYNGNSLHPTQCEVHYIQGI